MVLLDLLRRTTRELHVVHVNYGFRGAESDAEEQLVRSRSKHLDIAVTCVRPDAEWRAACKEGSMQEAARDFRYAAMHQVAGSVGATYVAVGHHLDDQAETILLRLSRGAGIAGIAGMAPARPLVAGDRVELIRPMLSFSRDEILRYAETCNVEFLEDHSNQDERFDRARLRNRVMPALRDALGEAGIRNIAESGSRLRETFDETIRPLIKGDLAALADRRSYGVRLEVAGLKALDGSRRKLVLLRALEEFLDDAPLRSGILDRMEALLDAEAGKQLKFRSGSVWRDRDALVFVRRPFPEALPRENLLIGENNETAYGRLTIEILDKVVWPPPAESHNVILDGSVLDHPLTVGPAQEGERFQPLGLDGTKKLTDFLTDAKVPTFLRRVIPVVRSGGEVAWVAGIRPAHRFRLRQDSSLAVRVKLDADLRV